MFPIFIFDWLGLLKGWYRSYPQVGLASERSFTYTVPMSKRQVERSIQDEITFLNEVIDRKIIKGYSYKRDALQHKMLMEKLRSLRQSRQAKKSWISRSASFVSLFSF